MADEFVSNKACGEISTRIFVKLDSIERRLFRDNGTLSIQTRLDRHEQFIRVILWALSVVGGAILKKTNISRPVCGMISIGSWATAVSQAAKYFTISNAPTA